MMTRRSWLVYGTLLAIWAAFLCWQVAEHVRFRQSSRDGLVNRAKDISTTLGLVMRSQRRFGVVSRERLESALRELVQSGEVNAIVLLNIEQEVVAYASTSTNFNPSSVIHTREDWEAPTVSLVNLVDLGTASISSPESDRTARPNTTIVIPDSERTNRPPPAQRDRNMTNTSSVGEGQWFPRPPPDWGRGTNGPRFGFPRPFRMSETEFKAFTQKKGVHGSVIAMSTKSLHASVSQDSWLRAIIAVLATVSVVGTGFAWRTMGKSADLQLRLVRASELNTHLKEMNVAAAGLAHETRNPLNMVRGLAHMISKHEGCPAEVRQKSGEIIEETDRVTAQLNEFINYSRPREVRRSPVALNFVVSEVLRTLTYDVEEKRLRVETGVETITVEADEQLLRQALFNLVINAIQAVPAQGRIQINAVRQGPEAFLEVRDDGPGVPSEHRTEIFKPYFTTSEKGTGLGLAVVQQIVLAHGWEIECFPNEPAGAVFRISHLKLAGAA